MCRYQIRLLPLSGIALSALMLALLPSVVSFRFLDFAQVAVIGEGVAPLIGLLLLTPLAFREDDTGRREALGCRPTPYWAAFAVRLGMAVLLATLAAWALAAMARAQSLPFDTGAMALGLAATLLLYGAAGLTLGHCTRSQPVSYLVPFAAFLIEFFSRGRYTGRFFTLSLMEGALRPEKWVLLGMALALLALNVALSAGQVSVRRGSH